MNLLGKREPSVYGSETFEDFYQRCVLHLVLKIEYFQSNIEGYLNYTKQGLRMMEFC